MFAHKPHFTKLQKVAMPISHLSPVYKHVRCCNWHTVNIPSPIFFSPLFQIPDVCVDEHAVHFRVHIFNKDLKAIERASFWELNLLTKPLHLSKDKHSCSTTYFISNTWHWFSLSWSRNKGCLRTEVDRLARFSLTIPSLAAKKANTWDMKCCSSDFRLSQWDKSFDKST